MKSKNIFIAKFTVVAVLIGLFSPSIQLEKQNKKTEVKISILQKAEARRVARKGNVNRNVNRKANVNRNVNRKVNVNVNHYGGGHSRHHYGHYHGHPILRFTTAMAIGSMIAAATMPTTCTTVVANNVTYKKCSNSYYQPFYQGDTLVYKVVNSPY